MSEAEDAERVIIGHDGENFCPYGTVGLTEDECRTMPNYFDGSLNNPFVINSDHDPQGCFFFNKWFYYNVHPIGKGVGARQKYCKRSDAWWLFQRISNGVCSDYGFLPIFTAEACESAATKLALAATTVTLTGLADRPEGCYYFENISDGTATLWVSTHPSTKGRGAENSENWRRQPVCAAQTTTLVPAGVRPPKDLVLINTVPPPPPMPSGAAGAGTLPGAIGEVLSVGVAGGCPYGFAGLTEDECRGLPSRFGGALHEPLRINSEVDPEGCFFFYSWYYYNTNRHGRGRSGRTLYCRREPLKLEEGAAPA